MAWWSPPVAAAAFAAGIWVVRGHPVGGAATPLLAAGMAVVVGAAIHGRAGRARSRRLLRDAGLIRDVAPFGPRDRILAAAGFPAGPNPPGPRPSLRHRVLAVAGFALLGAGWGARAESALTLGGLAGQHVRFHGTVAAEPVALDWGSAVEIDIESVRLTGRTVPVSTRLSATLSDPQGELESGIPVAGVGTLRGLRRGESPFTDYLLDRGIAGRVSTQELQVLGPPTDAPMRLANAARHALANGAHRVLGERQAGLLLGLSIGDTRDMGQEVEEDFRASGLGHLVAVSGSNVAMFLVPFLAAAGRLRTRPWIRFAIGAFAVVFFALITRWEPSVLRAAAMAILALAGAWAGRPRRTADALGIAVVVLLVADPRLVFSVGFQLSVAATAGLATMARPLAVRFRWLPRAVALAAAATVAAQVAVTPLLLAHFGLVPTVALIANVMAVPAVPLALLSGTVAALAGSTWESMGRALGAVASLPLDYLIGLADRAARLPFPALTGIRMVIPFAALAALLLAARKRALRSSRFLIPGGLAVLIVSWAPWSPPSTLTITFLDVGQGDAAVVRTPEGATVLVDAGPEEQQVSADLAALGVRRIDLAVASHAHADHIEGFPAVLARFPVGLFLEPGCPSESPSFLRLRGALNDEHVTVRHPRGGQKLSVGQLLVEVLGPDRCSPRGEEPNDDSLVLRLSYGGAVVLFTGDAEAPAQQDMLEDHDPVQADVLKVPHHGGDTSDPSFFDEVGAQLAVVSTGPNDYGHPHPAALDALREAGTAIYRTDVGGAVTVRFGTEGVLVDSEAA
ncbi:MAG TPA: DNA internalization-related competence protein ComEC/Rec2 [Actinomycetota bacterium]|nr:DNA internalization-related competence protein ComEC/Rec2 [Actinomycetota bacterium]